VTPRFGLTLPSFRSDPEPVLAVGRAAEEAGLDGVFAFDHLFRERGPGLEPRPSLELLTTMGAVAAETSRVVVGSLVARASVRPPASLVAALDTLARIAPGRLVAGLGAGDEYNALEDRAFGVLVPDRLACLAETVARACGRGYPVWVGGGSPAIRRLAATQADGWNLWGGDPDRFARRVAEVHKLAEGAGRDPKDVTCSWAGLVLVGSTEAEAAAKMERLGPRPDLIWGGPERVAEQLSAYAAAGAAWLVVGPIDSSDPDNAAILGRLVRPFLT
jgi:alkanesulfonate monooxygenase SsuD/methylene tetrahydromethanopterin reductase-like flavin-dependent oxidoreductase (luciferase family)